MYYIPNNHHSIVYNLTVRQDQLEPGGMDKVWIQSVMEKRSLHFMKDFIRGAILLWRVTRLELHINMWVSYRIYDAITISELWKTNDFEEYCSVTGDKHFYIQIT